MPSNISVEPCNTHACHHHVTTAVQHQDEAMETAFRIAEKVTVFALGVFALLTSPVLFISSFAIGSLIGIFTHIKSTDCHSHKHSSEGSCSHGFFESRLGIKLPESIALLAGAAVVAEHIDHHSSVFVPIAGMTFGIWAGNLAAPSLQACFKKITAFASEKMYDLIPGIPSAFFFH